MSNGASIQSIGVQGPHAYRQAMSLRGTIRRPDKAPLGTEAEVMRHLSDAFPGVSFEFEAEEPPGTARAREQMSFFLRLWLAIFGVDVPRPRHTGYFERAPRGGIVEFRFVAAPSVPWVIATSYGMTAGLDDNFAKLQAATGWVVEYPNF
jgi:hypothetical protein